MNTANRITLTTALVLTQAVCVRVALANDVISRPREIRVTDTTRWINVQSGDLVRIRLETNGRTDSVTLAIDENGRSSLDLADLLPGNVVAPRKVTIYIASNPLAAVRDELKVFGDGANQRHVGRPSQR